MSRVNATLLCLLIPTAALAQPPEPSGQATCERAARDAPYHIAWNLSSTPRSYYWVQQFIAETQSWHSLGKPVTTPYAIGDAALDEGSLYRVYACNDLAATQECIGTTICWAPLRPRSTDQIPAAMPDGHGQTMVVAKDTDLETQTQQYNVYRLVQLAGNIDLRSMPPMTPPPERHPDPSTDSGLTPDDLIHLGVYENYEALRELAMKAKE
jgi:hypothetical protein